MQDSLAALCKINTTLNSLKNPAIIVYKVLG